MEREEAEAALGLIRKVVEQTRDDLVAQNWGLLWMLHSFSNFAAFATIGLVVEARGLSLPFYLAPLVVAGVVNAVSILLFSRRDQGLQSFVEQQMHGIWGGFIVGTGLAGIALHLAKAPPSLFVYVVTLTSALSFSMMGTVFTPKFFAVAAAYGLALLAFPFLPSGAARWLVLGALWWCTLFFLGFSMHRIRRTRTAATRIL
jgi:hypothetical protein